MVWSPEQWQQKLENLIEQCSEQVLQELEKEITKRLKRLGESRIEQIFQATPEIVKVQASTNLETESFLLYAFAVLNFPVKIPTGLKGLDEIPLTIVREGELAMLVCPVSAADFAQQALHEHMEDLTWVEKYAEQHEQILLKLMETESFIPLPFCTIFTDFERIKNKLRESAGFLQGEIEKIKNRYEMSLKLFVDHESLLSRIKTEMPYTGRQTGNGYFQRRQWEKQIEQEAERIKDDYGESLLRTLKLISEDTKLLNIKNITQPKGFSPVFAAHFLLAKKLQKEWESKLEEFDLNVDQWGFILETSGPWPPYHFTGLKEGEENGGGDNGFETSQALGSG